MENSSRSGIDYHTLVAKFEDFKRLPFPEAPQDDDLYDIFTDLVEYDSHIAGLVTSFLNNKKINRKFVNKNNEIENKISSLSEKQNQEVSEIKTYKNKLDNLVDLLKELC
ncbi:hypothetical protein [Aneurinibacillus tyrosinisolvens]|uniref:hypothetical protein n=1 Tax=Aneurinibacillus tyrosinisolvens TaxID=1443435 RepID=UPI00063F4C55|nr:hypothetical protein [Aneurinibacillus tyrosinisolvens]